MTIYTSGFSHYSDKNPLKIPLADVISDIRGGKYSDVISKYRLTTDPELRAKLKKNLPAFSPSIEFTSNKLNSACEPTGIIQFDLDAKDNPHTNMEEIRAELLCIPELAYCFHSPSNGLKFALKSDFKKNRNDTLHDLKTRFQQAYRLAEQHIDSHTKLDFELDDCSKSIRQLCFVSYDEDAYVNLQCDSLKLNEKCKANLTFDYEAIASADDSEIEQLLLLVPRNLGWHERLPVNFAVLYNLGRKGIPMLMQHWSTEDRVKLENDLNSQLEAAEYGDKGVLVNLAKQHPDYKTVAPHTKRKEVAVPHDYEFQEFYTTKDASLELDKIVSNFFESRKTTFVNISTGHGKTTSVLNALKQIPMGKQVLFLTPGHKLAAEVLESYEKLATDHSDEPLKNFRLQSENTHRAATHLRGKTALCKDVSRLTKYTHAGIPAPIEVCKNCTFFMNHDCDYIEQFSTIGSLRIMTHDQLWNKQAAWYYGHSGNNPKKGNRKPDYIIVDEDWLKDDHIIATSSSELNSLRSVIGAMMTGKNLVEAIRDHSDQILLDREASKLVTFPSFSEAETYTEQYQKAKKKLEDLPVLEALFRFITTEDQSEISRLKFDKDCLHLLRIKTPSERYSDVPILYLDATADEKVIKAVLGDVDFHSIQVIPSDEINVYQAENFNVTKGWFQKNEKHIPFLLEALTRYKKDYANVGVITYQKVKGVREYDEWVAEKEVHNEKEDQHKIYGFDEWIAEKCGLDVFGHFNDIRGRNEFAQVDCLLILGRHFIKLDDVPNYSQGIFGVKPLPKSAKPDGHTILLPKPIRMKNGGAMSLNNYQYFDNNMQAVANHFCSAETKQAVGRGRLIWGAKKDIYIFSKESLDGDIQVTAFFRQEDVIPKYRVELNNLKKLGYCHVKAKALRSIGFSEGAAKLANHQRIKDDFLKFDIELAEVTYKDKFRKQKIQEYFCYDKEKLRLHLEKLGGTAIEMRGVERGKTV